jgi:hypothetical protein
VQEKDTSSQKDNIQDIYLSKNNKACSNAGFFLLKILNFLNSYFRQFYINKKQDLSSDAVYILSVGNFILKE